MIEYRKGKNRMFSKRKFFGNRIEPACEYCANGTKSKDGESILCERQGIVAPYFSCRKFVYDPLKRIPKRMPKLPDYDEEMFKL